MTDRAKDIIQYGSALVMLASGIVFCGCGLIVEPVGVIDTSVLWYTGQVMVYAGSAFGVKTYVDYRITQHNTNI